MMKLQKWRYLLESLQLSQRNIIIQVLKSINKKPEQIWRRSWEIFSSNIRKA